MLGEDGEGMESVVVNGRGEKSPEHEVTSMYHADYLT